MIVYLAGENGKTKMLAAAFNQSINQSINQSMRLYLAGEHPVKNGRLALTHSLTHSHPYILESYYYCRKNKILPQLLPHFGGFLLDSGAFSFMFGAGQVDWNKYVDEYAKWVVAHDVKLFLELDVDAIVGLKKVEELRDRLHQRTGKASIPVWHISRGKDYYLRMCEEYKYIAFGGLMSDGVSRQKLEKSFPWFLNEAHKRGTKVHGLGYTSIAGLHKYHFDSVDSTAWLSGNRGGFLYVFNPKTGGMDKIEKQAGQRLKGTDAAQWNFNEWLKFQKYADKYL